MRYIVLRQTRIHYFTAAVRFTWPASLIILKDKKIHKGSIDLETASACAATAGVHKQRKYVLSITTGKRTWYLAFLTETERDGWLHTITRTMAVLDSLEGFCTDWVLRVSRKEPLVWTRLQISTTMLRIRFSRTRTRLSLLAKLKRSINHIILLYICKSYFDQYTLESLKPFSVPRVSCSFLRFSGASRSLFQFSVGFAFSRVCCLWWFALSRSFPTVGVCFAEVVKCLMKRHATTLNFKSPSSYWEGRISDQWLVYQSLRIA